MKRNLLFLPLLLLTFCTLFQACDDDETYADKRKRESKQIKAFIKSGVQIKDDESGEYLLNVPGDIKVISESEFYQNDSTTDVSKNEYVYFSNTGVYMQILQKGKGKRMEDGDSERILTRYTEFNISTDSIQSTNQLASSEMVPDVMTCTNTLGTFSASFVQGMMFNLYNSAAVPPGWLVPLSYINLSRVDDGTLAHVRLIVPSSQGQANASANVYPCFYEITYQRGR